MDPLSLLLAVILTLVSAAGGVQPYDTGERALPYPYTGTAHLPAPQVEITVEPTALPEAPEPDVQAEFIAGYRAAGGPESLLPQLLETVWCESRWNPTVVNRVSGALGLAQFLPSTWAIVGGGDWTSPWRQGYNSAVLISLADPAGQWACWA